MAAVNLEQRPWLKIYPPEIAHDIDTAGQDTLALLLNKAFQQYAQKPAFDSFGKVLTFAEVQAKAASVTAWLQQSGYKKGDRIALMMPNIMAYPVVLIGALLGGYTIVNVNPLYTARELTHQLNDSGARALFVIENFANVVQEALPNLKLDKVVICTAGDALGFKGTIINLVARYVKKVIPAYSLPGAGRLKDVLDTEGKPQAVTIAPDDIAFLQYTGGTTGVSKGATLLHRNVAAYVVQSRTFLGPFQASADGRDVMITALPLYHIFALTCCCMQMMCTGACCVLIANPRDIPGFIKTLKSTHFTMMSGVNTLYNALANHPDIKDVNFSAMKFSVAGGMATQRAVAQRWKELTGRPIVEGYGLSETSPVATVNLPTITDFTGTIGVPVPGTDVSIRDDDGKVVARGESGEICIKGPQVMAGYWQRPDETAKVMTPDGYFKSGDVGIMLPDGQFKIVDRKKDMVLVSGFNVYPNEVEDVLAMHPGVLEAAVIGLPDKSSGEAVAAYVVKKDPSLTEEALRAHARENLTAYKVPKHITFREALPKTNVGKVLRRVLRDEVMAENKQA